jgi:hypothetical protein
VSRFAHIAQVLSEWLKLDTVTFYWDLISYGIIVGMPPLITVMLFHFWTIPDYTEPSHTRQWIDAYVFTW